MRGEFVTLIKANFLLMWMYLNWLKISNVCPFLLLALKIKINHEPFSLDVVVVAAVFESCCFSTLGTLDWF